MSNLTFYLPSVYWYTVDLQHAVIQNTKKKFSGERKLEQTNKNVLTKAAYEPEKS